MLIQSKRVNALKGKHIVSLKQLEYQTTLVAILRSGVNMLMKNRLLLTQSNFF